LRIKGECPTAAAFPPLQAHGLRECALGGGGGQPRVPPWLEKWTALILEFVEEEQGLLPAQLLALPRNLAAYTPASAAAEAKGAAAVLPDASFFFFREKKRKQKSIPCKIVACGSTKLSAERCMLQ
jgi:hypothetical protein